MGKSLVLTTTMPALHGGKIKIRTKDDMTHNIMLGNKVSISSVKPKHSADNARIERLKYDLYEMYSTYGLLNWNSALKNIIDIIAFHTENLDKKEGTMKKGKIYKFSGNTNLNAEYNFYLYGGENGVVLGIAFSKLPECKNLNELVDSYKFDENGLISSEWFNFIKGLMSNIKIEISNFIQSDTTKKFIQDSCIQSYNITKLKEAYYPSILEKAVKVGAVVPGGLVYTIQKSQEGNNILVYYPSRVVLRDYMVSTNPSLTFDDISKSNLKKLGSLTKSQLLRCEQVNSIEDYYDNGRIV